MAGRSPLVPAAPRGSTLSPGAAREAWSPVRMGGRDTWTGDLDCPAPPGCCCCCSPAATAGPAWARPSCVEPSATSDMPSTAGEGLASGEAGLAAALPRRMPRTPGSSLRQRQAGAAIVRGCQPADNSRHTSRACPQHYWPGKLGRQAWHPPRLLQLDGRRRRLGGGHLWRQHRLPQALLPHLLAVRLQVLQQFSATALLLSTPAAMCGARPGQALAAGSAPAAGHCRRGRQQRAGGQGKRVTRRCAAHKPM